MPWGDGHEWRGQVLNSIAKIFNTVCPYVNEELALAVFSVVKGYLLKIVLGTGVIDPVDGSRMEAADLHMDTVYNTTYDLMGDKLRPMSAFWNVIINMLGECERTAVAMEFWDVEEADDGTRVYLSKRGVNGSVEFVSVEGLSMKEQADFEYSFNWVLDVAWRIFATVLGACMPVREVAIPLVTARFYALFTDDFYMPLRQIW